MRAIVLFMSFVVLGCEPAEKPAIWYASHAPADTVCAGCWDGEVCHADLPPEPDPCIAHACGEVLRCGEPASCGSCAEDEACVAGVPGRVCAGVVSSCHWMTNGTPCSVGPVVGGVCMAQKCTCFGPAECVPPSGCSGASCEFGVCVFEPEGCDEAQPATTCEGMQNNTPCKFSGDWIGACASGLCCWSCAVQATSGGSCPYVEGSTVVDGVCQTGVCWKSEPEPNNPQASSCL